MAISGVAPFMGAWIETPDSILRDNQPAVAPFMGAWIETSYEYSNGNSFVSLPSWERGLKPRYYMSLFELDESLPSWERGLKQVITFAYRQRRIVAPFMGAWIETSMVSAKALGSPRVAPFMGAWIETSPSRCPFGRAEVAPFMGAWIETCIHELTRNRHDGRSLHGSVD